VIEKTNYTALMRLLAQAQVNMVVIGGVAMIVRSADYMTFDLDICYERSPENIERLCRALAAGSLWSID